MYELLQQLIAFKYACKIKHWSTDNYAHHLLFDKLTEEIDTWVDNIAESYFMANGKKSIFKPNLLNPKLIDLNLTHMCETIISELEEIQMSNETNEGIKSLLSSIEQEFLNKIALTKLI